MRSKLPKAGCLGAGSCGEAKDGASRANVLLALSSNAIGNDSQELAYLAKALKLNAPKGDRTQPGVVTLEKDVITMSSEGVREPRRR
jgi:hypothetical protein